MKWLLVLLCSGGSEVCRWYYFLSVVGGYGGVCECEIVGVVVM